MTATRVRSKLAFLQGGGDTGARLRAADWTRHPLGQPSQWPQPLRIALRLVLNADQPAFIFWGPEYWCFHNDAAAPALEAAAAPGARGCDLWGDTWPSMAPSVAQAMAGEGPVRRENQRFPVLRNGRAGDARWTCTFAPIDDGDRPGGVIVLAVETTRTDTLRESETRLQLVQAAAGIGSLDWDMTTGRIFRSREYLALHGLPADAPTEGQFSEAWRARIHPEDRAEVDAWFADDVQRVGAFEHEYRIVRADDGRTRWILNRGCVAAGADGKPARLLSAQTDITERKRSEAALRAGEAALQVHAERLNLAQSAASFASMDWDMRTGRIWRSKQYLDLHGLPSQSPLEDGYTDAWQDRIHPDDRAGVVAAFEEAIARLGPFEREYRTFRADDGAMRWVLARGRIVGAADGKPARMLLAQLDITERKRAQAALDTAGERLSLALDAGQLGVWDWDSATGRTSWDARQCAIYGVAADFRPEGDAFLDFVHPQDRTALEAKIAATLANPSPLETEFRITGADGQERHLFVRSISAFDANGAVSRMVGVTSDITARKRVEQALRDSLSGAEALQTISTSLMSEQNPGALYERILEAARGIMRADAASIQRLDPDDRTLRLIASKSFHPQSAAHWLCVEAGPDSSVCGQALQRAERFIVPDVEAGDSGIRREDLAEYRRSGLRAVQSTPLMSRTGRLLGMLSTHWRSPHAPPEQEFRLFDVLARQAADLIERAEAEQALRVAQERQSLLLELSDALRESRDPVAIQAAAARVLGEHLGASRALYTEVEHVAGEQFYITRHDWVAEGVSSVSGRFPISGRAAKLFSPLRAGRTLVINDVAAEPALKEHERDGLIAQGLRACIAVPLLLEGNHVAMLSVHQTVARAWTPEDIAIMEEAAERTWAAVARAAALEALRESEERYRQLFESMDEGFCVIEVLFDESDNPTDYRFMRTNPAFQRQTGLVGAEMRTAREMVPGLEQHWFDLYGAVARTGEPARFESGSDAMGRWFDVHAFRIGAPEARQVAILFTETSARRAAEAALRELNQQLEARVAEALSERRVLADIVEGTDAFVQVADLEFRWLAINKAAADEFERIFGVRPSVGQSMLDVLADRPVHQESVKAVWARALAGEAFTDIAEFGDPARDRRHYEMRYNVLRDAAGQRIGAYQFVYDVTERLRDQARLAEAETALRQAQKMEAVGQLTGGVAHDFNNLLMAIVSGLRLLDRPLDAERRARVIEGMNKAAERGAGLTRQLLAFSRRRPLDARPLDLRAHLAGMRELLDRSLSGDVTVTIDLPDDLWPVEVDPGELELALLNLCVNARDAMPEGGEIRIGGKNVADRQCVALSVSDSGVGMSAETAARVFEPFFTTKDVGKGSGLGLAQVYAFAQNSSGSVAIDSSPGDGTTVTLRLPRSRKLPKREDARAPAPDSDPGEGRGHVLLVEDDVEVAALTRELLSSMGYAVTHAASAEAALGAIARDPDIDLVISDVMMPGGMSGVDLAREVRKREPGLPVILATGYIEAAREAEAEGVTVLVKPYQVDALTALIDRGLRQVRN